MEAVKGNRLENDEGMEELERTPNMKRPGEIQVIGNRDPRRTGNFEVTRDGNLIHTKTTRGQGKCESAAERAALIEQIKASKASKA